ncbi:MAG: riboflavin synthase [Planctomycetota bacterium]|jgi:riboflavin synthase
MFTGLVRSIGTVLECSKSGDGVDLRVRLELGDWEPPIGASIALSGVCCTVVEATADEARFHLSAETLRRTWLGRAVPGTRLNIEPALCAGDPLGGHIVQGHVDSVGRIETPIDAGVGGELWVEVPVDLRRFCVEKGSITIDGVSLTIAALDGPRVMIAVIPHTAQVTTLGGAPTNAPVHLEVDVLGKYVERLLEARFGPAGPPQS